MPEEVWTIKRVLDWATEYFKKAGIENPHLEAEILLAHAINKKRIDLYIQFEKVLSKEELSVFKDYIQRRKAHEPSAYITGIKSFMSLDFAVTRDVLIPRPETELLVESTMDIAKNIEGPMILDIGTGSGAVAVSLAKYIPSAKIVATDTSEKALQIATDNAKKHGVADRITFEATDIFPKEQRKFDLIVSNPPYIKTEDIEHLAPEVKGFEPRSALDGGKDGMDCYRRILGNIKGYISGNGYLLFEVGAGQAKDVLELIKVLKPESMRTMKDLSGIERIVIAKLA